MRLVEAERAGRLKLLAYDAEPYCWRDFGGQTLKPDAFVQVGVIRDGKKMKGAFFLELDRNEEWGRKIASKVPMYLACRSAQIGQGPFPRVLFLAPTEQRVGYLKRLTDAQAGPDAVLFKSGLVDGFEGLLLS